jgi:hypothetical protein
MKKPLPDVVTFGSPSEARTLLEACGHLCKKVGFDEAVRMLRPNLKIATDTGFFSVPPGMITFTIRSPYNEEESSGEDTIAEAFGSAFLFPLLSPFALMKVYHYQS